MFPFRPPCVGDDERSKGVFVSLIRGKEAHKHNYVTTLSPVTLHEYARRPDVGLSYHGCHVHAC